MKFKKLKKWVQKYPNDYELGQKVRAYVYKKSESKCNC